MVAAPRFNDADYILRWPRSLFVKEASRLLNQRDQQHWNDACELLLEDAFIGDSSNGPVSDYHAIQSINDPWGIDAPKNAVRNSSRLTDKQQFLRTLMQNANQLTEGPEDRKPYWSQRKSGAPARPARQAATVRKFISLVSELEDRGYLEKAFEKDCVDSPSTVNPSAVIEYEIGVPDTWPLSARELTEDPDLFCDIVEVLHDLVARPESRWLHSYAQCGWHHTRFSIETGRAVYRWRVNQLLERSELGFQLADGGEDLGRIVATTDDARNDLVEEMLRSEKTEVTDQVRHAIALYRGRGASEHEKRSAVFTLCRILEERRKLIRSELLSKDEDALFMIANKFNIRHQNEMQRSDYDTVFLDWLFWWYLATIDLTDHIASRPSS